MDSQDISRIERDISTIKETMSKLVDLVTEVSLHNKRIEYLEGYVMECNLDRKDIWKSVREIHEGCIKRDAVYQDAKKFFSREPGEERRKPSTPKTPDEWFTMFLGGGLRNGIWIALSNLITVLIMKHFGG